MLVLFLLLHFVLGNDTPKSKYIMDNIDTCPDIGYYFKRESNPNALDESCYLCFCQNNGTAVCWPRDNRRCDKKHYYHAGRRKRDFRMRRSPAFTDIFFRDAARDIFNRQLPEQCKPHESSFSEGCPPADWCVGCTVCDCDANGRWDCHILSFCSDNKGKKQAKKRKSSVRNKITKRQLTTKAPKLVTAKKQNKKPLNKNQMPKKILQKQNKKQMYSKNKKQLEMQKKKAALNKSKISQQKKVISTKKNASVNNKTFQQNKKPNKPTNIYTSVSMPKKTNKNNTAAMFAETIFKQVMASVEKILNESQKNASMAKNSKIIQKRSMSKQVYKKKNKRSKMKPGKVNKINKKQWINKVIENKQNEKLGRYSRRKREINFNDYQNITKRADSAILKTTPQEEMDVSKRQFNTQNEFVLLNVTSNTLNKHNYFHYTVVSNDINDEKGITTIKPQNESYENTSTTTQTKIVHYYKKLPADTENIQNIPSSQIINKQIHKILQDHINVTEKVEKKSMSDKKITTTCGKICEFKKYLKKSVFDFHSKSSTISPNIKKESNILDKVKIFLTQIFKKQNKGNKTDNIKKYPFRKQNFIKVLCKSIDSCKYNATDKLLHSKLNQLKVESNKIIKSVKIIKGLLKLLSFNKTCVYDKFNRGIHFKNNDEKILTAILKDEYEAFLFNLTETQRVQIRYIKENTIVFIESIENFANILSDLVEILSKKYIKKKDLSRRHYRCLRKTQNKESSKDLMTQKLEKLKNLLKRYNLVQNKFMKQMYEAISALNSTRDMVKIKKMPKVSYKHEIKNRTITTDIYVENIVRNLRKLKELALKLSSKNRRKRSALDDDHAIEYLLTLMEYILKQNRPLDVAPAKDGIDLIIEAIKNAPDVKSVKKKVLDYISTTESTANLYSDVNLNNKSKNIQEISNGFKTFESMDNDESGELEDSHSNDLKENNIEKKIVTPEVDINYNNDKTNNEIETKQKFEIFFDDDADVVVENATKLSEQDIEISTTTDFNKLPTRTLRPIYIDSQEQKTKLDWIEENFSNEKRVDAITEKILKVTRTLNQNGKHPTGTSSMTAESVEKNEKINAASDEVYKRQMNLFNTLDYETERSLLDSDSREDKYNVEALPMDFA